MDERPDSVASSHEAADRLQPTGFQERTSPAAQSRLERWQRRLLPLMSGMLIALTVFFFLVTFIQISYLHYSILGNPSSQPETTSSEALLVASNRFEDLYAARQFEARAALERYIIEQRYHQVSVLLMSGLWLRYLGFLTGMILALVGSSFILGKLREPEQELSGGGADVYVSLRTSSPGIILAVLGVILMFATLMDRDNYNIKDTNVYLPQSAPVTSPASGPLELIPLFDDPMDTETGIMSGTSSSAPAIELPAIEPTPDAGLLGDSQGSP